MAENRMIDLKEREEPVNLLYLATQQGLNYKEMSLPSRSQSQPASRSETQSNTPVVTPQTLSEGEDECQCDEGGGGEGAQAVREPSDCGSQNSEKRPGRLRQLSTHICSVEERDIRVRCPRVNCPEKIIICLDISNEMENSTFRSRVGDKFAPIQLIKRALGIFLNSKHLIDHRHEFALIFLQDAAFWMSDFTTEPQKIITILEDMSSCVKTSSFDLSSIFEVIQQNVRLPVISNTQIVPPPYIIRTILIYGRSHCIPSFSPKSKQLTSSPYFFVDAYYLHEVPSDENKCEAIFDVLCSLDTNGLSYISEVSRNPTKLYDCMAQLLPHPLQRPIQRHAAYDIEEQVTALSMCSSGPQSAQPLAAS